MLTVGSLLLIAFVAIEWKFAKLPMMPGMSPRTSAKENTRSRKILIDIVSIFQRTPVVVMLIQSFLFGAVYQSYLYYVPLYLQNAHQFTVIPSAAIHCSLVVFQSLVSIVTGRYISWRKRYGEVIWAGFITWTL